MWKLVLIGFFFAGAQAFAPVRIQWAGISRRNFVLIPKDSKVLNSHGYPEMNNGFPQQGLIAWTGAGPPPPPPYQLTIWEKTRTRMFRFKIPTFMRKSDKTIIESGTGLCLEASGDKSGDDIRINRCTGGRSQLWNSLPRRRGRKRGIQLRNTNMCIGVNDKQGLNGAPVELRECQDSLTEAWTLDPDPEAFDENLDGHTTFLSSMGSSMRYLWFAFSSMVALGAVSFAARWRWQKSPRVVVASGSYQGDTSRNAMASNTVYDPSKTSRIRSPTMSANLMPVEVDGAENEADGADGLNSQMQKPEIQGFWKHKSLLSLVNSVAFMGLTTGFNMGIVAGTLLYLEMAFPVLKASKFLCGAVTSSAVLSAFFANVFVGPLADRLGRMKALRLTNVPFLIGAIVSAVARNPAEIIVGRVVTGFGLCMAGTLPNLYISEIAPSESRGRLVGKTPMFITIGLMFAQLFSAAIAQILGESASASFGWRIMFACGAIPAIIQHFWSQGAPESPRWCYQNNDPQSAEKNSKLIADMDGGAPIEAPPPSQEGTRLSLKFAAIAIGLSAIQQLSGINAVIFYAPKIYQSLGIANTFAILIGGCISLLQIMSTYTMTRLVDKWGRRTFCKIGLVGMVGGLAMLGSTLSLNLPVWVAIAGMLVFRLLFSLSLGPLPYIIVTELFPQQQRAKGAATSMMVNYFFNFLVVFSTPTLMHLHAGSVFYAFALVCVLSYFIVERCLPETAGMQLGTASSDRAKSESNQQESLEKASGA